MQAASTAAAAVGAAPGPGDKQGAATASIGPQKEVYIQIDTPIRYAAATKLFRASG